IIHIFLFPASQAFNSFYDRDVGSIGGLKKPPPVEKDLLFTSIVFDVIALISSFFINAFFAAAVFIYGICSKLYSYDKIRLKKKPVVSWLGVGLLQGSFIFLI